MTRVRTPCVEDDEDIAGESSWTLGADDSDAAYFFSGERERSILFGDFGWNLKLDQISNHLPPPRRPRMPRPLGLRLHRRRFYTYRCFSFSIYKLYYLKPLLKFNDSTFPGTRDIKCANILVDASGSVELADFGLAKEISFKEGQLIENVS